MGTRSRTKSGRDGVRMSGELIITRSPTRLPCCFAAAKVAFQYGSGSRRPGFFCSSRQVGRM